MILTYQEKRSFVVLMKRMCDPKYLHLFTENNSYPLLEFFKCFSPLKRRTLAKYCSQITNMVVLLRQFTQEIFLQITIKILDLLENIKSFIEPNCNLGKQTVVKFIYLAE